MHVETLEGRLRQVREVDDDLARLRVGVDGAGSFTCVANPSAIRNSL